METFLNDPDNDPTEVAISLEMMGFDEECPPNQFSENEELISLENSDGSEKTGEISYLTANKLLYASSRKLIQLVLLTIVALALALIIFVYPRNFGTESNTALIYDGHHHKTFNGKPAYQDGTLLYTAPSIAPRVLN
eukprot:gene11057-12052_t